MFPGILPAIANIIFHIKAMVHLAKAEGKRREAKVDMRVMMIVKVSVTVV